MGNRKSGAIHAIIFLAVLGFVLIPALSLAEDDKAEERPDRLIEMAVEYPAVEVAPEEDVSMDIIFYNKGKSDENVEISITQKPANWKARVKTYRYTVYAVHVPATEKKTVTFEAGPGKDAKPGKYQFRIEAKTPDNQFKMAHNVTIGIKTPEEAKKEVKGVKLTTSYPVLRGPSDATFEFSIEVDSKLDKDAIFDLFAQGPEGWEINFKPAYEDKYISSVRIKGNQSQTVAVQVKPARQAQAGEYPFNLRVSSAEAKGEAKLMVILTGTYKLDAGTPDGLLSLTARQGKPGNISFYVKNTGSAPNNDIEFKSFKPENWKVAFKPEKIPVLKPDEFKQVEVMLTPYEEALVGDYSVSVSVDGEKASKNLEFRVTVKASSAWGWIGIGIIVVVIGGLFGIFRWLGRR